MRARSTLCKMIGAPGAGVAVNDAGPLDTIPERFVAATVKLAPLSGEIAAGIVKDASVAPAIFMPFFFH